MSTVVKREQEILEFWKQESVFQKTLEKKSPKGDYVFYDGPPFATGLPHYGHILGSVIKDVVPRYWTMKGYHVRRRWGWDCHGLPIETLVEKKLGVSGKKDIEEKIGIEKFNQTCREEVLTYAAQWKDMIDRIGRWVEFDNAYKTMDTAYMESVWWALRELWDKKLIYEGRKVLLYCPRCETPVSRFEVAMDNSYHDVTDTAVTVKFTLTSGQKIGGFTTDDKTHVLAWTTTPWTLPGNVALAVGEDIKYDLIDHKGESLIVAHDRREVVDGGSAVKSFSGKELVGLNYEPLFEVAGVRKGGKKSHYIAPADFVTTDEGTGVVHTAVIYGEDDYNLGKELGLPMVPLLDSKGIFNNDAPALLRGKQFKKSEPLIIADLEDRGLLFKKEAYTHSYPHCWRCESALFYNAVEAWFIDIQSFKKKAVDLNEKINWVPDHLKHGRFLNIVKEAPDWNISRNRYWATALPFWKCESGTCKPVCIGSIRELQERAINFSEVYTSDSTDDIDLHKHQLDKVTLACSCGKEMTRIPEVIDCWVESASMPFAEYHYPFEHEKEFTRRFPGDYIAEYIAQTRTWFYYMHMIAVALFKNISFKNVVTTGTILNEHGDKMSKSKMNYPDPWNVITAYGADALRFHLMNSVVMQAENLHFNEKEVREAYNKVINTIYNVVSFYQLYAEGLDVSVESDHVLDRWILSRLHQLVRDVTGHMDAYDTVKATRLILDFVQDLSTWYVRRSRDRCKDAETRPAAMATLNNVLQTLAKVTAPIIPFTAEHIWRATGGGASVHLEEWPKVDKKFIDEKVMQTMDAVRGFVERGHALRAEAGIKVRQPLAELVIDRKLPDEYLEIIADEVNVKQVSVGDALKLETELTDALRAEGALRELIRAVNAFRKQQGLAPKDAVIVHYATSSNFLKSAVIEPFVDQLKQATISTEWKEAEKLDEAEKVAVNGQEIFITLEL